ncbi:MAG: primosome assembly protein PriA [Actinomycetales bacterium]|nr:primosome assembly protein PriA [Actinomycetales bacterium]
MSSIDRPRPAAQLPALPVAAVVVDSGLAHLDREFEYAVPADLSESAQPGVRVRVRFAGRDVDGFVVARRADAEHEGRLAPLRRVVSPEPVLTPEQIALCRAVAHRYAGVLGDLLRLAIPPRHAAAERALDAHPVPALDPPPAPDPGPWTAYPAGPAFLRRIAAGEAPAASWLALPGQPVEADWPHALAVAAGTAAAAGRGVLLVVPDQRDLIRVEAQLIGLLGAGCVVRLTAEQGPQARYTAWLKALRGHVRVVVGTRAAAFAPVQRLGLVAWWDDGDDLHQEPRAPYPHVREVLALRAQLAGAALLSAGFTRSVPIQQRVESGEYASVTGAPATVRAAAPRVIIAGEGSDPERDGPAARAHLPSAAWRAAKSALADGPVLVQVPRRGYLPALSCQVCRAPAGCPRCHGPMAIPAPGQSGRCRWCAGDFGPQGFVCPHCEGTTLRSATVGARRTAEELGRAFPGVPLVTSGSGEVTAAVPSRPALVVATPGAEPIAEGGYRAALLLDAWALLERADLDAGIEALRRWCAAAALVRPADAGGVVVVAGVPAGQSAPPVEALVRWDPAWLAARELSERIDLRLPPASAVARLAGSRRAVLAAADEVAAAVAVERLGPLPIPATRHTGSGAGDPAAVAQVQVVVRTPLIHAPALAQALTAVRAVRSARKDPEPLTIRVDWLGDQ